MQSAPVNPDRRILPSGWTERYSSQKDTWYYVQTNVVPPLVSYYHPAAEHYADVNRMDGPGSSSNFQQEVFDSKKNNEHLKESSYGADSYASSSSQYYAGPSMSSFDSKKNGEYLKESSYGADAYSSSSSSQDPASPSMSSFPSTPAVNPSQSSNDASAPNTAGLASPPEYSISNEEPADPLGSDRPSGPGTRPTYASGSATISPPQYTNLPPSSPPEHVQEIRRHSNAQFPVDSPAAPQTPINRPPQANLLPSPAAGSQNLINQQSQVNLRPSPAPSPQNLDSPTITIQSISIFCNRIISFESCQCEYGRSALTDIR
ncbi:hypothetical protein BT96DRAFT_196013 [Gymnopus androsaceus JB14]|uniref:WW domain-containing protein n=1 Tax=Gymnopus androsaceus JB14 TaxID=1447944 RepID=A0A6A4H996_9AGAR|nr:hypothetical protein BT96DRAFT_196013 [Gymnopus androsaceus JB14]